MTALRTVDLFEERQLLQIIQSQPISLWNAQNNLENLKLIASFFRKGSADPVFLSQVLVFEYSKRAVLQACMLHSVCLGSLKLSQGNAVSLIC